MNVWGHWEAPTPTPLHWPALFYWFQTSALY